MVNKKASLMRVEVTLLFDFGKFWEGHRKLYDIQRTAEKLVQEQLFKLSTRPEVIGKIDVLVSKSDGATCD